jgi:hypothetical protein
MITAFSTEYVASGRNMSVELGGRDRFKFFRRPVVPAIEGAALPPIALSTRPTVKSLHPQSQLLNVPNQKKPFAKPLQAGNTRATHVPPLMTSVGAEVREATTVKDTSDSGTKDAGSQTLYRENECQTDPFTPDYFIQDGTQPEVLAIMELRYGEGLPAALAEVEMIDRVQRRKLVEASLPQGNDPASMEKRLRSLETLERTEWEEREAHIKLLQDERLRQVERALEKREKARESASSDRVDRLRQEKLSVAEMKLKALQEKRLTATRKLTVRHSNPCCEKEERNIIEAHVKHGSRAAPVATANLVEAVNTANYDVRPTLLSFHEGVVELEKNTVPKIEKVKLSDFQPPNEFSAMSEKMTNYQKRKAHCVKEDLEYADKVIQKSKETTAKAASIQDLYRATPRLQRPDTPTLILQGDDEEDREEAMLLLQRLLRGRAVQNDFFDGKERCHGLIEELQAATKAQDGKCFWQPDRLREQEFARQEAMVQSVVDGVIGDVAFGTVDYLYKELLRQQQVAKVDQLRVWAQQTRAEREEAESKRRQNERQLRLKEETQYQQLIETVDSTVESYLNRLVSLAAKTVAEEQAVREALAAESAIIEPNDRIGKEEFVCELIDGFIIPEAKSIAGSKAKHVSDVAVADVAITTSDAMLGDQ